VADKPAVVRILIADDHALFRDGLRRLLETERDFRVVGGARDGLESPKLAKALRPDILLLDLAMPRAGGLEALRAMAEAPSPVRTILLTGSIETRQIVQAIQLGARGVVLKESAAELLFGSIRAVMAGQYWLGRETVADLVQALRALTPHRRRRSPPGTFGLTARELEIVSAVVAGLPNRDIAGKFSLSEQTVKHHLTRIFDKVGVSTRVELAVFAIHHGLGGEG
jgi:DNA-binding NarL/FixJ family response regulator